MRDTIVAMIFKPAARFPADPRAVFILALSVFSGAVALTRDAAPDSLEALLPGWGVTLWSALLAVGSLMTLVGMYFQSVNGIIIEQVGSITVAAATIFYSTLALMVVGPNVVQSVGIILAWGLASIVRWLQLQVLIHNAIKRQQRDAIQDKLDAELDAWKQRQRRGRGGK